MTVTPVGVVGVRAEVLPDVSRKEVGLLFGGEGHCLADRLRGVLAKRHFTRGCSPAPKTR